MLKRFWRAEAGIFLGLWLVLLVGGRSKFFQDPGTFWHTVTGQRILATRHFLDQDPYSFTFAGRPWVPYEWLAECAMAILHAVHGLDTLLLATVTLLAGLYAWVAHRLIQAGLHWSLAAVLVLLTVAASSSHFHVRPHILTMVFFAGTVAGLIDYEVGRIGLRRLLWLLPLYVIWTNCHGGMLGGWCTMVLALAGWTLWRWLGLETPLARPGQAVRFGLLVMGCGLTMLVNPYGWGLPRTWLDIMSMRLPELIVEHAPLNPAKPDGQMVLLFAAVYLIALLGVAPMRPRVTWLLPLVWFYLACTRIRHSSLFALSGILALAGFLPYTCWARWMARPGSDLFQFPDPDRPARPFPWQAVVLPVTVVLAALGLQAASVPVPVLGDGWAQLDPALWPVELETDLRNLEKTHPPGTHIFNDYRFGGFLIYFTPGLRVYIDDRCEVYGEQWVKEFDDASKHEPGLVDTWSRDPVNGFEFALVHTGTSFDVYLRDAPGWTVIRRTEAATLYRRNLGPTNAAQ